MAAFVDPNDHRRTDTRQRIVEAAQRLIKDKGFRRTTIADLERAVGLRPGGGGLYRHFASKDEVLEEVVGQYADRVRILGGRLAEQRHGRAGDPQPLDEDLLELAGAFGSFLAEEAPVARLHDDMEVLSPGARQGLADAWDAAFLVAAEVFEEHGVAPERAHLLAVHSLLAMDHFASHVASWGRAPLGIDGLAFARHWADTWSAAALEGGAAGVA